MRPEDGIDIRLTIDNFQKKEYSSEDKNKIISFLKNSGSTIAVSPGGMHKDMFTDKNIGMYKEWISDGNFNWSNSLSYYVDKYDAALPTIFEKYILNT